jgi:hypothetical protein
MKMKLKNRTALIALLFALALPLVPKVNASEPFATNYSNAATATGQGAQGGRLEGT